MEQWIFYFSLILLLGLVPLSSSYQVSSTPTSSIKLQKILNILDFQDCRLKVSTKALYICKDVAEVFDGKTSLKKFSQLAHRIDDIENIIDADISQGSIVAVSKNWIKYIGGKKIERVQMREKIHLLVRINSIETHASVIVISRVNENTFHPDTSTKDTVGEYMIDSYLFGPLSHVHHLKFPKQNLDFQLQDSSFRDATIFHDPLFGNDYLIVALENGWLHFFKSFFEDPQLEILKTVKITTEYDIKQIATSSNMLVMLLQNLSTKQFTLEIYRIIIPSTFDLRKECSFTFREQDGILPYFPQIRIMKMENTFLISVNFPSSHILVFTFQRPVIGIFPLECPAQVQRIKYSDAIENVKVGYSFDYINTKYSDGTIEQGFLLSPFPNQYDHTYFFPYCIPNFYLNTDGFCELCTNSYSQGGFQKFCEPCDIADGKLARDSNPLIQTCQTSCNSADTFGRDCNETCESYLIAQRAILPPEGFAAINTKGLCSFQCKSGYVEETYGQCLKTEQEFNTTKDQCAQFNDCMNCTMTQGCSWHEGTCKSSEESGTIVEDFLDRAVKCDMIQSCGLLSTKNTTGVFTFTSNTTYKNQVCKWHVQPQENNNYSNISMTFSSQNSILRAWDNPPHVYMRYCETQLAIDLCWTRLLPRDGKRTKVKANDVVFYVWVHESMLGNAHEFRLSYKTSSAYNVFGKLFGILGLLLRFAVICIVFACFIFSYQRLVIQSRRRRLFRELQGIELVDTNENEDGGMEINTTEATENNRLITRATFESDSNEFEQNECPICLADFKVGESLAKLCCKHIFHVNCFHDWAQSMKRHINVKCPVCNKVLV